MHSVLTVRRRAFIRTILMAFASLAAPLPGLSQSSADDRPNVVVFIADDVSWNDYGCYGNPSARTPSIDRLAAGGIRFDHAYLTASSCSPSRASILTGRYPHNNGKAAELHLPVSEHLPWFPELLRKAGYYTALSGKNHPTADTSDTRPESFDWVDNGKQPGNSGGHANWLKVARQRPADQPFFFWFAALDAHRAWDADRQWHSEYGRMHTPDSVNVPPFLVDTETTRQDLASYYNEITRLDYHIGQVMRELRRQQVLDNTLVFVLADNGRPFPRAKTRLHDSGMKTALVAHWPAGISDPGATTSLVSAIDLAPTILDVAGIDPPPTMQGVSMRPVFSDRSASIRKFAFSEHNWHDYAAHGRSVRDGQFLYIQNNRPEQAWQGPADSVRSPSHADLQRKRNESRLTPAQADVFTAPRPTQELYLADEDPHQMNNLVGKPEYDADLIRLRDVLAKWQSDTADSVPDTISADSFDRDTGERIVQGESYRGTTPGEDLSADKVNASGPR